jgi:hypothetical protein
VAGLVCVGLVGGVVSPVWAAEGEPGGGDSVSPVVGGFGLGDGLEALVGERDGSLAMKFPVAGLGLRWDSRAVGVDVGFGKGWTLGTASVDTSGGVRVVTSTGRAFRVDPLEPSGLSGYETGDLAFRVGPGTLPARTDAAVGAVEYAYVLRELGGVITYFSQAGDPVARVDGFGNRTNWTWQEGRRLVGVVDADGVVTGLDWDTEPGVVLIRPSRLPLAERGTVNEVVFCFLGSPYSSTRVVNSSANTGVGAAIEIKAPETGSCRKAKVASSNGDASAVCTALSIDTLISVVGKLSIIIRSSSRPSCVSPSSCHSGRLFIRWLRAWNACS